MRKIKGLRGTGKRYSSDCNEPNRPIISIAANGFVVKGSDHHHIELLLQAYRQHRVPPFERRLIPSGLFDDSLLRHYSNLPRGSVLWLK